VIAVDRRPAPLVPARGYGDQAVLRARGVGDRNHRRACLRDAWRIDGSREEVLHKHLLEPVLLADRALDSCRACVLSVCARGFRLPASTVVVDTLVAGVVSEWSSVWLARLHRSYDRTAGSHGRAAPVSA